MNYSIPWWHTVGNDRFVKLLRLYRDTHSKYATFPEFLDWISEEYYRSHWALLKEDSQNQRPMDVEDNWYEVPKYHGFHKVIIFDQPFFWHPRSRADVWYKRARADGGIDTGEPGSAEDWVYRRMTDDDWQQEEFNYYQRLEQLYLGSTAPECPSTVDTSTTSAPCSSASDPSASSVSASSSSSSASWMIDWQW